MFFSRDMQSSAIIADTNLHMLLSTVPKIVRWSKESNESSNHLATQGRLCFSTLQRRNVKVHGRGVYNSDGVRLGEVHRRFVLEERESGSLVHLAALLHSDDFSSL